MGKNEGLSPEEILKINKDIEKAKSELNKIFEKRYKIIRNKVEETPSSKIFSLQCIELEQGFAHLEMLAKEEFLNWEGTLHGGITAFLVDTAIGAAASTLIDLDEEHISTFQLSVNYLSPAKLGECVCAKAWFSRTESLNVLRLRPKEKKILHFECHVIAKPERRVVAHGTGWFVAFGRKRKTRKPKN